MGLLGFLAGSLTSARITSRMDAITLVLSLAYALAASAFDLKERRIPNSLNYAGIALAVAAAVLGNANLVLFAAFSAAAYAFSYLLYRLGAWAGGDAKFFTALSMLLLAGFPTPVTVMALFILGALISVPLALAWRFKFNATLPISRVKPGDLPQVSYYLVGGQAVSWSPLNIGRMMAAVRTADLSALNAPRGMLLASASRARGLTAGEISALKEAGVKDLPLRRTMAFAPMLAAAYVMLVLGVLRWLIALKLA